MFENLWNGIKSSENPKEYEEFLMIVYDAMKIHEMRTLGMERYVEITNKLTDPSLKAQLKMFLKDLTPMTLFGSAASALAIGYYAFAHQSLGLELSEILTRTDSMMIGAVSAGTLFYGIMNYELKRKMPRRLLNALSPKKRKMLINLREQIFSRMMQKRKLGTCLEALTDSKNKTH